MTHLLERFALLGLDPETGEKLLDDVRIHFTVAGATLAQGLVEGHLRLDDAAARKPRFVAAHTGAGAAEIFAKAYAAADGRTAKEAIGALTDPFRPMVTGLEKHALEALQSQGAVAEERNRRLGIFPHTVWNVVDTKRLAAEREQVRAALESGTASPETSALIGIAQGSGLLAKLFPEADKETLKKQAEALTEGDWGSAAVADALRRLTTIMIVGAVV